jgi:two-component system, NtrC family, sensor histidine kinase KinB
VTLRTRLLLAQAPLAAGLVLVGVVALTTLQTLGESSQLILRDNFRSVLAAQRMKEAAERVDSAALFLAAGRPDRADEQAPPNIAAFESQLQVQERNITEPGEAEATQRLRAAWHDYVVKYQAYRPIRDANELRRRYFDEMQPAFVRVKNAAERVLEINQDAMLLKSEQARNTAERSRSLLLLASVLALGLALFASVSLTRRALVPLQRLTLAVRRIGEGDLDARARLDGQDEIAQVGRELDTMADKLREYRTSSLGELLQAQQASQAAIDSLPDPVLVLSLDGTVLNVNQAAENLLRVEVGRDPLSGLPPALREAIDKVRAHIFGGRGAYAPRGLEEAIRVEGDGGGRALLPRATPLYSEQGNVTGATIVLQDVTRLLRFDELKNDLVATVAHEFRTPLTSMRMAVHILLEGTVGPLNEKQLDLVSAARDDSQRLQDIVEDLLDLSRIEAGKVEVSLTALPAKSIVDAALDGKVQSGRDAGLKLEEELVEPVLPVLVDPERIGLVFDNLIGNAVRHSPKGGRIIVRARPQSGFVRFEIEDQGPGIPPEYQQRIFEKFFRMPGTKGEGIGLGLYISREIVAAHGGQMGVESEPGHGSRFWFTLRVPSLPPPRV